MCSNLSALTRKQMRAKTTLFGGGFVLFFPMSVGAYIYKPCESLVYMNSSQHKELHGSLGENYPFEYSFNNEVIYLIS
jgi:hypothetical protein